MKLNLVCGDERLAGFLNVDLLPGTSVDVVADLNRRPWNFADASVECTRVHHVFEHFADKGVTPNEGYRILVPNGCWNSNCQRRTDGAHGANRNTSATGTRTCSTTCPPAATGWSTNTARNPDRAAISTSNT